MNGRLVLQTLPLLLVILLPGTEAILRDQLDIQTPKRAEGGQDGPGGRAEKGRSHRRHDQQSHHHHRRGHHHHHREDSE